MGDIRQFTVGLDSWSKQIGEMPPKMVKAVAVELFRKIVKRTPVDTGRARASWTIASNAPDRRVAPVNTARTKTGKIKRLSGAVVSDFGKLNAKKALTIWISNNLPYIVALEKGHSQKAPHGMVALSIAEMRQRFNLIVKEHLKRK